LSELTPPDGPDELAPTGEVKPGTLGRYRILGELGRGGCGIVYRALDPSIGRVVAIKTILAKTESDSGKESRERFRREARSAGNLSHPNIVTVHDFGDSGDPMFIAMEFIEGHTLAEAMSRGPLELNFILGVLRSASDALDYAHSHHIVHRDIKPANFLINTNGRLKITDFGIAKILDGDEGLTSTGMLVGTAQYMSPEQVSEAHVTGRSDQFSLAVIAYEMLTGMKPFQGNSWASVIHAIIMAEPPLITKYRGTLGETVNTVLRKALAKDPRARYATCTEFCEALEGGIHSATQERTAILPRPVEVVPKAPVVEPAPAAPISRGEVRPEAAKALSFKPLLIGALGGAVIAAGLWFGLRGRNARTAAPPVVAQSNRVVEHAPAPSPPPPPPGNETTPVPRIAAPAVKQAPKQAKGNVSVEPVRPTPPVVETAPPPVPAQAVPAQAVPTQAVPTPQPTVAAPAPIVVAAPTKAPDDQAKRLADEQAKRAADQQAKAQADEQLKRAADEQATRQAEERAKNVRIAETAAISKALNEYQGAYTRKDLSALQAVWPSIPKQVLDGIRSSFRDASEVTMDLRPVGDPKVAGGTATVICDRNLRQVILKRVLQASGRVRIVLIRAGAGWTIQSVDPVNQ